MYNNNAYYYLIDIEGKICGIIDSNNQFEGRYEYSPYGEITNQNEIELNSILKINHIRYKSYYYDDESNMYYLINRYYLPSIGRFISPDNINYLDDDSMYGYNLYAYANNNPILYKDPDGRAVAEAVSGVIIIIAALILLTAVTISINYINGNYDAFSDLFDDLPDFEKVRYSTLINLILQEIKRNHNKAKRKRKANKEKKKKQQKEDSRYNPHDSNKRPSNLNDHQEGLSRKKMDMDKKERADWKPGRSNKDPKKRKNLWLLYILGFLGEYYED